MLLKITITRVCTDKNTGTLLFSSSFHQVKELKNKYILVVHIKAASLPLNKQAFFQYVSPP